jgi:tryptophan-rich sensory protein
MNKVIKIIVSVLICQSAGFIGSLFTTPAINTWYANILKPSFNPPSWLFAPVWTALFFLMGLALYLVWEKRAIKPMIVFFIQLFLNITWSFLFFYLHSPFYAFLEIILLWLAILATILVFSKVSKAAAFLLLPYWLWVSFAGFLNFTIWQLNP